MEEKIVLTWPYKDRIMITDDSENNGRSGEWFPDQTLTEKERQRLFQPRVLEVFIRYTPRGEELVSQLSDEENYLIKGNNLLALHSLKRVFSEKIKLIYIDPPYNTGKGSFGYNDRFRHSVWLTFMKNRLEAARELLSRDGSIWINIDDEEAHYLKVLCDEIFGRENFVANVIWQKKFSPQNDAKYFSDNHDHILVYARNKAVWRPNLLKRSDKARSRYKNPDNDPRGPWASGDLTVKTYNPECDYPIRTPAGKVIRPPKGVCWRVTRERFAELAADGRIWFGKDGKNVPRLKRFLSEVKDGMTPLTIWTHQEVGHNQEAKQELRKALNDRAFFHTPKPERLLKRILEIGSAPGDLVMDFFAGSGTTAAVALKMQRKFIAVEQMDYIRSLTRQRLINVLRGESSGISERVGWQGGGSFVYAELAEWNRTLSAQISQTANRRTLLKIFDALEKNCVVPFWGKEIPLKEARSRFEQMAPDEQRSFLHAAAEGHRIYIPVSEVENQLFQISEKTINLNKQFYHLG